jgi:hypothetical protein
MYITLENFLFSLEDIAKQTTNEHYCPYSRLATNEMHTQAALINNQHFTPKQSTTFYLLVL